MPDPGDNTQVSAETSTTVLQLQRALKHPGLIQAPPTFIVYWSALMPLTLALTPLLQQLILHRLPGFRMGWSAWTQIAICVVGLIGIWLFTRQLLRKVHRFRLSIKQRIEQADLLERVAQGPGGLPDIYEFTPQPWRIMLGSRPKTLARWLQVVAFNIEWYLLPVPRRYIKLEWKLFAIMFGMIPVAGSLPLLAIYYLSSTTYQPGMFIEWPILPVITLCYTLPILVSFWHSIYQACCVILTRQALSQLIGERYALQ